MKLISQNVNQCPMSTREFVLYSRLGRTDNRVTDLHDAGRLDIVYECAVASLFLSHGIRRDTVFHAVLNGPPNPPVLVTVDGSRLFDVRTDQETWNRILKKTLSNKPHPGISMSKTSFEQLVKTKGQANPIYVLEEHGTNIKDLTVQPNPVFILGDHVGLPKNAERYALRYGTKISLGKTPYLASTCITILNYILDIRLQQSP
jgi:tRNA (pseudouridine54-N1)-methyltransferase